MAYLHSDREQFRDAIDLAYEQTGVMVQAIEKDYYVTMLLRLLAQRMWAIPSTIKVHRSYSQDRTSTTFPKNSGMWQRTHIRLSLQGMILKRCKKS